MPDTPIEGVDADIFAWGTPEKAPTSKLGNVVETNGVQSRQAQGELINTL
jgi:hypothetical protein